MTAPLTFQQASCAVAARFLHSVVVVDDRADYSPPEVTEHQPGEHANAEAAERVTLRSRRASRRLVTPATAERRAEDLDAKSLVDGFAEKGLVCAILRPGKTEQPEGKTVLAASRSDIVVLDWNFYGDDGLTTCEILSRVLRADEGASRLRLIAIYTGERHLRRIATKLRQTLNKITPSPRLNRDGEFAMSKGAVRIVVFAKEDTPVLARDLKGRARVLKEAELPERLVTEFASLTEGLVSNVALESLAALRENTHRLLGRLRPSLDPAYLWHRAIQGRPSDAEDHLVSLVASEVRSVLDDEQVGRQANLDAIDRWLARNDITDFGPHFGEATARTAADVHELLDSGTAGKTAKSIAAIAKFKKMKRDDGPHRKTQALAVFANSAPEAARSNEEFAALMSLKTHYTHPIPQLQLGTLLSKGTGASRSYWLCVQPRCDSVRLDGYRAFPLLPLTVASDTRPKFDIVLLKRDAESVKLRLSGRPYDLSMVSFLPTPDGADAILAVSSRKRYRFNAEKAVYWWEGDLKDEHAQRVADNLAFQFGRVGLTESEWLLLSSTK
jgi:hypothetical protein